MAEVIIIIYTNMIVVLVYLQLLEKENYEKPQLNNSNYRDSKLVRL
jgi:hypothetical protein